MYTSFSVLQGLHEKLKIRVLPPKSLQSASEDLAGLVVGGVLSHFLVCRTTVLKYPPGTHSLDVRGRDGVISLKWSDFEGNYMRKRYISPCS